MRIPAVRPLRPRAEKLAFLAAWMICLAVGFGLANGRAGRPGADAHAPAHVEPVGAQTTSSAFRLLVFVHPQCPCSRATIEELDRIAARIGSNGANAGSRAQIRVCFFSDPGRDEAWTKSDTWRAAQRIPGVEVVADPDGATARSFGARTSGETLLYSPAGDLVFHGGITSARGHAGDNAGASAIVSALLGDPALIAATPVFGCALFDDESPAPTADAP